MLIYDPTSERFARRMARRGARPAQAPADLIGLEYEFEAVEMGARVSFGDVIDEVVGGGERRWFPFDSCARFLASGAVVTCDETEAELAIPPITRRPGVATIATDELLARRGELYAAVHQFNEGTGRSLELRGYSTHLSAYCPPATIADIAHRFSRTAAPATMLLLDLATSPGSLVRPRGNRLEIAGEYVGDRDDLRAATIFFIAALLATAENMPLPMLDGPLAPAPVGGGWFVDRTAFGDDLYLDGRMARLALTGGGTILAGSLLGEVWAVTRPLVESIATREELALVDDSVTGERPLPLERTLSEEPELSPLIPIKEFAQILRDRRRDTVEARPVSVSWDAATLEITTPYRSFYASVARESFPIFVRMFDRGSLDRAFLRYARRPSRERVLELGTTAAGLFDAREVAEAVPEGLEPRIVVVQPAEATLTPPRPRHVARKVAVSLAAAGLLGGGTALAMTALPSPDRTRREIAAGPSSPTPQTDLVPAPTTKQAVLRPTPHVSPSVLGLIQKRSTGTGSQVQEPEPAPQPTPTQAPPQPSPKPTATKPPSPQPTPTPSPTQSSDDSVHITAATSCSLGTSVLDFVVKNASSAPGILDIYVAYNNQKVPLSVSPEYPTHYYQGRTSSPVPPAGGNHRWVISVRDAGGHVWSDYFIDHC